MKSRRSVTVHKHSYLRVLTSSDTSTCECFDKLQPPLLNTKYSLHAVVDDACRSLGGSGAALELTDSPVAQLKGRRLGGYLIAATNPLFPLRRHLL